MIGKTKDGYSYVSLGHGLALLYNDGELMLQQSIQLGDV